MNRLFFASVTMMLVGCGHTTKMEHVHIDNSVNTFIGNPCTHIVNDKCRIIKPTARNPDAK